jgi:GTP cyclohydrolase II
MSLQRVVETQLPTPWGKFQLVGFHDTKRKQELLALIIGNVTTSEPVLARLHSECLTGDSLFSLRCDCGFQLQTAMRKIAEAKRGVLLYQRQEGRGIGLLNKLHAYALQDQGADTVEANHQLGFAADERDFSLCAQLFRLLGIGSLRLLTNNPHKINALQQAGLTIIERVPLQVGYNAYNQQYLATKATKLGHWLEQ